MPRIKRNAHSVPHASGSHSSGRWLPDGVRLPGGHSIPGPVTLPGPTGRDRSLFPKQKQSLSRIVEL